MDPYAPTAARPDVDMSSDTKPPANAEELPEVPPPSASQQPVVPSGEMGMPAAGAPPPPNGGTPGASPGLGAPPVAAPLTPETNVWQKYPLPNKKDIGFKRGDGFFLRIRKVDSVPGKYLAQLWKGNEVLDKGQVLVPPNTNPIEYIKSMADTMLDDNSKRYEQEEVPPPPPLGPAAGAEAQAQPGAAQEQPELGPEPGVTEQPEQVGLEQPLPGEGAPPEEETPPSEDEDLGLDDENFEITDEDLPPPQARLPQR